VTIKGGRVQGFDVGLLVLGAGTDHIQRILSANNLRIDHNSVQGAHGYTIPVFC